LGNPSSLRKSFNLLLKCFVIGAILYVIYKQVFVKSDITEIVESFKSQFAKGNKWWLLVCFLLMPINWLLESRKWQLLISSFYDLKLRSSFRGILSGLTIGIITPQRIGEYGGRILVLPSKYNWEGVSSTFLCSIAQNIVNVALGLIGAFIFLRYHILEFDQQYFIYLALIGFVLLLVLYFMLNEIQRVKRLLTFLGLKDRLKPVVEKLRYLRSVSNKTKLDIVFLSFLRYVIYVLQYVLVLKFFGIQISWFSGVSGVALIYLIQTGIPLPPLIGIAARGEIALIVWGVCG